MYDRPVKMAFAVAIVILLTWNSSIFMESDEGNGYHTKEKVVYDYETITCQMEETTSQARVIRGNKMEKKRIAGTTDAEYEILCRIVQAEAGGEDFQGKQMVADVILNRVENAKFPNTIEGVVFQGGEANPQFSPIRDGRYYTVVVTKETRNAVDKALDGEDSSGGALYFVNADKANPGNYAWFENCLTFCREHGGHRFYK